MLHIIFLSPHSDPQADLGEPDAGGQCLYEHQLAIALSSLDEVTITTYCRSNGERPETTEVNDSYSIRRMIAGPNDFVPKEEIEGLLPEFIEKVKQELQNSSLTNSKVVLHGHYWDGAKAALLLKAHLPELPIIWTPHSLGSVKRETFPGMEQEKKYNFLPRYLWENYMIYSAQQLIVSTLQEKDSVVTAYQADQEKIEIIPPGLDFSHLDTVDKREARKRYNLPQEANILLCLGRMSASKGYQHAINALEQLQSKKLDLPTYLVICGGPDSSKTKKKSSDMEYMQELQELAKTRNLEKFVLFQPAVPHDEVQWMYRAADIFLMTSESEPFGLTSLEAMALNRPVVAFNRGGPAHLITHNQTGCLVRPKDAAQMAGYITALLKDVDYRSDITAQAFYFVRHNFDWQVLAREFVKVYEKASELQKMYDPFKQLLKNNYFLQLNLGMNT